LEVTLRVMRGERSFTVEVAADGEGLVSRAGAALLAQVADKVGLTRVLSLRLAGVKQRRRGHDPGRVIRDLAVMLADGGECVADLGVVRDQQALFGEVASDSTAFRVIDRVASEPALLAGLRTAHARARERFWRLNDAPERLTIDIDATLITAHSDKDGAAGNYKHGYGFHPLQAYADETREALAAMLRPGNAGANTATDHKLVLDRALAQIPAEFIERLEIVVRADRAGATHELADYCREASMRFSFGYDLTEPVRAAILEIPEDAWVPALEQDGSERENGEVCELTDRIDLASWPEGSRLIVRRERPHPGAQLSFTDHDGYRFQAILTDQTDEDIAILERRHRQRARVEDRIRDDKDTGLAKLPFKEFALNEVWLEIVLLAHDLIVWTQALLLDGKLAKAEPKRLRYRLLHVAGRLAFSGRRAKLHLQRTWPWATELATAFEKLKTLPAAAG
jgi:Transposase DDE domain group 1